jgi:hypothetical protein
MPLQIPLCLQEGGLTLSIPFTLYAAPRESKQTNNDKT